ncbi:MAG TPA: YggT family protein [Thermomicrobiales bacterium]|jgi:uncharacterized protein YggT (Ycf19 family)
MVRQPPDPQREVRVRREERTTPIVVPDQELDAEYLAVEEADALDPRRSTAAWTARVIYFCFAVIQIALGLRVLLKLIAANPTSGFTRFIYGFTAPFVAPFSNIVATPTAANGATLDVSSLLAILIYLLLSWLIVRLLLLLLDRPSQRPRVRD